MTASGLDDARLAVLVHELRSPVAALAALSEALPESPPGDPRRELVRLALAACAAIERLVVDVAVASVHLEPIDVRVLVHEAVASHVVSGRDVEAELGPSSLETDADRVRLRQALDNLIDNALAHGDGAPVRVQATRSGDSLRIAVSDAGPGIPADELGRIFELGARLSNEVPGSGIGLALARSIVLAHGGALEVMSTPGVGSTFTIALPLRSSA
jgi:signal transduction histidine kinase